MLDGPVLASGARELLTVVREQAVSRTLHRFGHVPPTDATDARRRRARWGRVVPSGPSVRRPVVYAEARMTSSGAKISGGDGGAPFSWSSRRAPAARAIATTGWITLVSGGVVDAATPRLS